MIDVYSAGRIAGNVPMLGRESHHLRTTKILRAGLAGPVCTKNEVKR